MTPSRLDSAFLSLVPQIHPRASIVHLPPGCLNTLPCAFWETPMYSQGLPILPLLRGGTVFFYLYIYDRAGAAL